jgi:hypothetical protein
MLCDLRTAQQTAVGDYLSFDPFPFDQNGLVPRKVNVGAFGGMFKARVRAMGIRDRPTSFRAPWQNGYAERLIGSVRRECTDHFIAFNADHLRGILAKCAIYYNEVRTHVLGGLHHRYARI